MARTSQTVTGADVSLFHVAARLLNDATQWHRIAQLNGLSDPMITSVMTLIIPAADPTTSGGIPQQ